MGLPLNLFRRKIWHCSGSVIQNRWIVRCASEVRKHGIRRLIASHEYVVGFDIPMPDAVLVQESDRLQELCKED